MNFPIKPEIYFMRYIFAIFTINLLFSCSSPKAAFNVEKSSYEVGERIFFENKSKNANEYKWTIDDDAQSEYLSIQPIHIFAQSGNYEVKLHAIKGNKKSVAVRQIYVKAPENCRVFISTNFGDMIFELYDQTPLHRDNFIQLADNGYYKDLLFHRVIEGFMAQAGDPGSRKAASSTKLGLGGPGYTVPAEMRDTLVHLKGALAAARTADEANPQKESSGSQFYIVQGRTISPNQLDDYELQKGIKYSDYARNVYENIGGTPQLDMEYTVFGRMISGFDVIDQICAQRVDAADRPLEDIRIIGMKVLK